MGATTHPSDEAPWKVSLFIFILVLVTVITCGEVLSKWAEASARRPKLEGDPEGGTGNAEISELREAVAQLSERLDRLSEEQGFLTQLLEDRPRLSGGRGEE